MKLFIWEDVDGLTSAWHDSGGLVIIAEDEESARNLWSEHESNPNPDKPLGAPAHVRETEGAPLVLIFPDAGCC